MTRILITILAFATFISLLCRYEVSGKPALNEENRNLCESEPDKAECIREVEEAKEIPADSSDQEDESAGKQDESNAEDEHEGDTMEEYLAKIDKVRKESEESRRFWREELRSMNKWEKYGLG